MQATRARTYPDFFVVPYHLTHSPYKTTLQAMLTTAQLAICFL